MFISKLIRTIETYDPYGIHRVNGIKVVYILLILFLCNMIFDIPHIYFYYFYLPITAMSAEVMFERIHDKYMGFIYTVLGACAMVFLFNILRPYPLFFLFSVFLSAVCLYVIALRSKRRLVPLVPIILSLATYSLSYPSLNTNLNMVVNNAITTLFSSMIVLSALVLFPLYYYYRLWLRAFILLLEETADNLRKLRHQQPVGFSLIKGHTRQAVTFAHMLPRRLPTFSILKMNFLANQLHLRSCVNNSPMSRMTPQALDDLLNDLCHIIQALKQEKPCDKIMANHHILFKLASSWNHICSRI